MGCDSERDGVVANLEDGTDSSFPAVGFVFDGVVRGQSLCMLGSGRCLICDGELDEKGGVTN